MLGLNLTSLENQNLENPWVKHFYIWLRLSLSSNLQILKYLYTFIVLGSMKVPRRKELLDSSKELERGLWVLWLVQLAES